MSKRKVDAEEVECSSKRVREEVVSLDDTATVANKDNGDIWYEPRSVTDLTLQVVLSTTETVTVHLHRVRMMDTSVWFRLRIEELIKENSPAHLILEQDSAPFRTHEEIQATFDVLNGGDMPRKFGCPLFLRVLHALDYFAYTKIEGVFDLLRIAEVELRKLTLRERIDLAKRYKIDSILYDAARDLLKQTSKDAETVLKSDAVVAAALAPHLFIMCKCSRASEAEASEKLLKIDIAVDEFFDSFTSDEQEHCEDGLDCDHGRTDHVVDHSNTGHEDYGNDPLVSMRKIRRLL